MFFDFVSKLSYHPQKVADCLDDKVKGSLSTVFLDLVSGICNHNCIFCDGHYNPLPQKKFSDDRLLSIADELKALNVNSVLIVGEGGESTLHPSFCVFSRKLLSLGIHVGLYTNGETLNGEIAKVAADFDFVRISLDSGCNSTHNIVHRSKSNNVFSKIVSQAKDFSKIKKGILGASFIVLNENVDEIIAASILCEECGFDFLELKPYYSPNYTFDLTMYERLSQKLKNNYIEAVNICSKLTIILNNQFNEWEANNFAQRNLTRLDTPRICYTSKLRMVVSPTGCYLCTCFRNEDAYCMGDPNITSLIDIWYGERHFELTKCLCSLKCTYAAQNQYLSEMKEKKIELPEPDPNLSQIYFL